MNLGDDDRIEMIDAMGSAWNLIIRRTAPINIEYYTNDYKNRPTIGVPSPRETVTETIGETVTSIDYGRPSMRGRKIFGNVVPYGEAWRTGAGAATTITFDSNVYVKSPKVKAGTYNVYSLPARDAFILILNSKLDGWGSVYLPELDVVRLPMKLERSEDTIDKFTMAIQSAGNKGTLVLSWEKVVAKLKFEVRK